MKKYFGYFSLILLVTGCIGETHCPAFQEKYLNWIPNKMSENLKFTDGSDTINFLIAEAQMSKANSFPDNCLCECGANAFFRTTTESTNNLTISGEAYGSDSLIYFYYFTTCIYSGINDSTLQDDGFSFEIKHDKVLISDSIPYVIPIAKFNNGTKNYSNVLKLENDTSDKKCRIWQVYVADSIGIIQFSDRISMKTWKLVE